MASRLLFRLDVSGDDRLLSRLDALSGERSAGLADDAVRGFYGPTFPSTVGRMFVVPGILGFASTGVTGPARGRANNMRAVVLVTTLLLVLTGRANAWDYRGHCCRLGERRLRSCEPLD